MVRFVGFGFGLWLLVVGFGLVGGERPVYLGGGKRVVFLGDSNTAAGGFVAVVDAQLRLAYGADVAELVNMGLASETCSGLSEGGHPFPRPNVHERLGRVLGRLVPDAVVVCYGMNDGIYHPFDEGRFGLFRDGLCRLVGMVEGSGAAVVVMTPPAFDGEPLRRAGRLLAGGGDGYSWEWVYEGYGGVMQRYADWVMVGEGLSGLRVNVHDVIRDCLVERRRVDGGFALSRDGVHINGEGHRLVAGALLGAWGVDVKEEADEGLVDLCYRRQRVLHAAWLSEVGHERPGVEAGLPLGEAEARARVLDEAIRRWLAGER